MSAEAPAVSETLPEALPENGKHIFYWVPTYPEYVGACHCGHPFGPAATEDGIRRAYVVHFRLATRAT